MLQKQKVAAEVHITPYAKLPATASARRCTGAARDCAVSTSRTMSASAVASPAAVARTVSAPSQFTVPAVIPSPAPRPSRVSSQHRPFVKESMDRAANGAGKIALYSIAGAGLFTLTMLDLSLQSCTQQS